MIDLDADMVNWYEVNYGNGRLSWGLNELLKAFKNAHTFSPQELAATGAAELKRLILSGEVEPTHDEPLEELRDGNSTGNSSGENVKELTG